MISALLHRSICSCASGPGVLFGGFDELLGRPVAILRRPDRPPAEEAAALSRLSFDADEAHLFIVGDAIFLAIARDAGLAEANATGPGPGRPPLAVEALGPTWCDVAPRQTNFKCRPRVPDRAPSADEQTI